MNIYIETLGCPKNVNDSEVLCGILENAGHKVVSEVSGAHAILVNTCCFIEDAKRESIDKIFELAALKDKDTFLIVSGCLPQRYGDTLYKQIPEADIFIGVNDYDKLPDLIENYAGKREKVFSAHGKEYAEKCQRFFYNRPYVTTLKIAEGCDNHCAYCVIPSIRGGYRSRRMEDILDEASYLSEQGTKELIVVAQDVTAYGIDIYGKYSLAKLLKRLCKIEGIRWIRLMYCYEDRITDELIETMRSEEKINKYIDIPIQHCNDAILGSMNRRSTKKSITSTIKKLRQSIPGIHIRTTLITGFPGEGKAEFQELREFVQDMKFERLGVFAYSREEGTEAARMKPQVRVDVKESRKNSLMLCQIPISRRNNEKKIGRVYEVIVEGIDDTGAYYGRMRYDAPEIDNSVIFTSGREMSAGEIVSVEITDAFDYDLTGREV